MAEPRLHLDADASDKTLHQALLTRGHDVTRTPNDWMALHAGDEEQLLRATARGRCTMSATLWYWPGDIPITPALSWPPKVVGRWRN